MSDDPRRIVADGYERLGSRYWEWSRDHDPKFRERYLDAAFDLLPDDSLVVELGSGSGLPTARLVTEHHRLVCVDVSSVQLQLVSHNVPEAMRVRSDMTGIQFRPQSVDAVVAFYSIIHLPRDDQRALISSIGGWLRPGGLFVASMGTSDNPGMVEQWIDDVPMYYSSFDAATNRRIVQDAGFDLVRDEVLRNFEDSRWVRFLWILARKRD